MLHGTGNSAGGMDGWRPVHFHFATYSASRWLCEFFTLVEKGHDWPEPCSHARAAFLLKPSTTVDDVLPFRLLTILPCVYRLWSKARLQDLQPWLRSWLSPYHHSAIAGIGAIDAWYATSIRFENAKFKREGFSGFDADIWKCFDQVRREIVLAIGLLQGMPIQVASTLLRFFSSLSVYNTLAVGIGRPMKRTLSIAQGDPLSMLLLVIILDPGLGPLLRWKPSLVFSLMTWN